MSGELTLGIRLKADGSGMVGEVRIAQGEIAKLGQAGRQAAEQLQDAGKRIAAGMGQAGRYAQDVGAQMAAGMGAAGRAAAELTARTAQAGAAAAEAGRGWRGLAADISHVGTIGFGVYKALSGLLGVMAGGAAAIFDAGVRSEKLARQLEFVSGSSGAAAREMEFVRKSARDLGLDLTTAGEAYGKLAAAAKGTALQGQATRDIFTAISQASTVMGLSAGETQGALLAISQMISKGTVAAEELRGQLGERLPGAFQIAARAMGVTTAELGKMLESGEIVADQFLPRFAAELEKTLGGSAGSAANSAQAQLNRLSTEWELFKQSVAESGVLAVAAKGVEILGAAFRSLSVEARAARIAERAAMEEAAGNLSRAAELRLQAAKMGVNLYAGSDSREMGRAAAAAAGAQDENAPPFPGAKPLSEVRGYVKTALDVQVEWRDKSIEIAKSYANAIAQASGPEQARLIQERNERLIALGEQAGKAMSKLGDHAKQAKVEIFDLAAAIDAWSPQALRWERAEEAAQLQQEGLKRLAEQEKHLREERDKSVKTLRDELDALTLENETYGMNREEVQRYTLAKLEARLASLDFADATWEEVKALEESIRLQREIVGQAGRRTTLEARDKAGRAWTDWWKGISDDIGEGLANALFRGFEEGKSFGENFRDQLKRTLQATVIQIPVKFVGDLVSGALQSLGGRLLGGLGLGGASGSAFAGAGGVGLGDLGGLFNVLGNGGAGGWSVLGGLGSMFSGLAAGGGGFLGGLGGAFGNMAVEGVLTGIGGNLSAGLTALGAGNIAGGLGTLLGTAMPVVGAGLAVASLLGLGKSKGGPASYTGSQYFGSIDPSTISAGMVSSSKNSQQGFSWGMPTNWFGIDDKMRASFGELTQQMQTLGQVLGIEDAKARLARGFSWSGASSGLLPDQGGNQEMVQAALGQVADQMATALLPNLEQFQQQGESLAQTLIRMANAAQQVKEAAYTTYVAQMQQGLALRDFVAGLQITDLSPLKARERLDVAAGLYTDTLTRARAGDMTAVQGLAGVSQAYLKEAESFYPRSTAQYAAIFRALSDEVGELGQDLLDEGALDIAALKFPLEAIEANTRGLDQRIAALIEDAVRAATAANQATINAQTNVLVQTAGQQASSNAVVVQQQTAAIIKTNQVVNPFLAASRYNPFPALSPLSRTGFFGR
jgi:tape measure domain-containing protein